jgi:hypothetical protein
MGFTGMTQSIFGSGIPEGIDLAPTDSRLKLRKPDKTCLELSEADDGFSKLEECVKDFVVAV